MKSIAISPLKLATLVVMGGVATSPAGEKPDAKGMGVAPRYLFVQNASSLEASDGKITLNGVDEKTIFFSDRPNRIAGHTPTAQFVTEWDKGDDNFAENNPNATLAVFGEEDEPIDAVVVLSKPVFADGILTYDVKILEGEIPASGKGCSLFIDIIGRPMTPVSVAGVARRTTRRHMVWGAAAVAATTPRYSYASPTPTTVVVNTPAPKSETTVINQAPAPAPEPTKVEKTPKERLAALQDLLNEGLITQAEYDKKRESILAEL